MRSKNIKYHFRQDNDFLYLTGFDEPDALALLCSDKNQDSGFKYSLFCRPKDKAQEVSFGERAGVDGSITDFNADEAHDIAELETVLLSQLTTQRHIFIGDELGRFSSRVIGWMNHQRNTAPFDTIKHHLSLTPLAKVLHPMRVIKSADEIAKIKAAVKASTDGHKAVMRACKPGINEAELDHYASDITRSYPVNGKFTTEQKAIYSLVLSALDAAITRVKPGASRNSLHETCMEVMAKGLLELGLLNGNIDEIMKNETYKGFTVHKTGHWLGMDVHDVVPITMNKNSGEDLSQVWYLP